MRKLIFILLALPFFTFAQNTTVRISPFYPMISPIITKQGVGFLSVMAFGSTLGYDQKISDNESIEFNFKPRIHIFDGDQDLKEYRSYINYKRFMKYNFYTSSGLAVNYMKSFISMNADGSGDFATLYTIGPNISIGRRTMLTNRLFLDFGLGFAFNYPIYNNIERTKAVDWEADDVQYYTEVESGPKIFYLNHILAFQFGFILN